MSLQGYLAASRQSRYSVTFALPLLLLYEGLTVLLPQSQLAGVRNGADVLLKTVFVAFGGRNGVTAFGLLLLVGGTWAVWRDRRRHPGPLKAGVLAAMLGESVVYAAVFGFVVAMLTAAVLGGVGLAAVQAPARVTLPLASQLVVSLGAGIYEELVFRVLLVSGVVALGTLLGWTRPVSLAVGVGVGGPPPPARRCSSPSPPRGARRVDRIEDRPEVSNGRASGQQQSLHDERWRAPYARVPGSLRFPLNQLPDASGPETGFHRLAVGPRPVRPTQEEPTPCRKPPS